MVVILYYVEKKFDRNYCEPKSTTFFFVDQLCRVKSF